MGATEILRFVCCCSVFCCRILNFALIPLPFAKLSHKTLLCSVVRFSSSILFITTARRSFTHIYSYVDCSRYKIVQMTKRERRKWDNEIVVDGGAVHGIYYIGNAFIFIHHIHTTYTIHIIFPLPFQMFINIIDFHDSLHIFFYYLFQTSISSTLTMDIFVTSFRLGL